MQPASAEGSNTDTGRALRRYGPIAAIAVVALVVIGVVIAGGGEDADAPVVTDDTAEPDTTAESATTDGEPVSTDGATPGTEAPGTRPEPRRRGATRVPRRTARCPTG